MDRPCSRCGGSVLAPASAGAERGSCHCPRFGRLRARMFYGTANQPGGWKEYSVEWDGALLEVDPPTLSRAWAVLNELRATQRATHGDTDR